MFFNLRYEVAGTRNTELLTEKLSKLTDIFGGLQVQVSLSVFAVILDFVRDEIKRKFRLLSRNGKAHYRKWFKRD